MGNAKSNNNSTQLDEENEFSRNLSENKKLTRTRKSKTTARTRIEDNHIATTTKVNTATIVGGPLLEEVENNTTKAIYNKASAKDTHIQIEQKQYKQQQQEQLRQRQQKAADNSATNSVAEQQRLKQVSSLWSLGSLNWNLSYSGLRNSYKQRQKSSRKSFHSLQQQYQCKRSKTQWHKPLTNAIFSSHFKEKSRNEEFQIDQLVAKGAFGVVFKVINKKQQQQQQQQQSYPTVYALKVLKKSKIISENSLQQIKDEVDIQKLCGHHPFIVKQIDLWQNRYNLHILSEYVPSGELFSTLRTFSVNLIRLYLAEIALALDFLHNAGIIYRDAKPENILLTSDYHLKLTDFGLSKWLKFGLTTKTLCGTFQYMAPEILRGEPYTHAVDWWSLGIIVCQMFVNKSPDIRQFITITLPQCIQSKDSVDKALTTTFQNNSPYLARENESLNGNNFLPEEVQSLPNEAQDVLKRLLEVDSQKRIHSVRALQRIALYKDFKIEIQYCLKMCPLDIIKADNIVINTKDTMEYSEQNATEAFKDF